MKTVRVVFSKMGRARFISHLDLTRAMSRAARRAGIPIWYTEGFNRHPYMTFAVPLSLGYEGEHETMDLRLEDDAYPMDRLVERLGAVMPEGLTVLSAAEAVAKPGEAAAAAYRLTVDCPAAEITALLSQPSVMVGQRTKQKTVKEIDIKPAFSQATVSECDGKAIVEVILPAGSETVNPGLLIAALNADGKARRFRILRRELLKKDGTPFR